MLLLQTTDISTQGTQRIRKHPFRVPLVRPPYSLNKWALSPGNKDALKRLSGHSLPAAGRASPLSKS